MTNTGHLFTGVEVADTEGTTQGISEAAIPTRHWEDERYRALKNQVERLWQHEREMEAAKLRNMSSPSRKTSLQLHAEDVFRNTIRMVQGSYEVGLIWKPGKGLVDLPNNYLEAKRIFLEQERRMEREPQLRAEYIKICVSWLKEASFVEIPNSPSDLGFYIPHFMVIRLDKTTTKYRLVMHGAMEFQGHSINHFLESGSNQINNLFHILLRLRREQYVLTGDVESMFMRIKVRESDCPALRIFFRESPKEPLRVLEGRKHLFGLTCSPFVAVMTMKYHAEAKRSELPVAREIVVNDMMVDDFCISGASLAHLARARQEMEELCASMGMRIHKYASNHPILLEGLGEKDIAKTIEIGDPEDNCGLRSLLNSPI